MTAVWIGFLVAGATAATGVGGSLLAVPLLILLCAVPAKVAVGTAAVFSTLVRIVLMLERGRKSQIDWDATLRMLAGAVPAMLAATWLLVRIGAADARWVSLLLVGLTIFNASLFHLACPRLAAKFSGVERRRWLGWLSVPIGVQMGFSAAGAGALGTLLLLSCTRLETTLVVGTVIAFGLGLSALASVFHLLAGHCDLDLLTQLLLGGMAGSAVGVWLAVRVPSRQLRVAVLLLLALVGVRLCWEGVRSAWWLR
ncbi:MAG: sulfite exporter TauE/SafE family protein [Bryobacterales bacterium]|nr:sulfite exporter TauE/SafE family protein [Bryobacteraceae bacterium]MDW8129883.1 sulfite exporter TauE/SafE family protein [Bryobacterales bacterium]